MTMVPMSYTFRSLFVRKSSTVLTTLSIGATVAVLAFMLCLQQGFQTMFVDRGSEELAIFMRPGATSEGQSAFPRSRSDILIKETPEIAQDEDGKPMGSAEVYLAIRRFKVDGGETNVPFRGVDPMTFALHGDELKMTEGRRFEVGADELIVGKSLTERFVDCAVGDTMVVNVTPFRVVGIFEGKGNQNSEIWGDSNRLMEALERRNLSRVVAKLKPGTDIEALADRLSKDKRVPAKVQTEREYLSSQTTTLSATFFILGGLLGGIMGIAAIFTGTNAMFSQIAARTHEIGVLLSMGFRPFAIFFAFLFEAMLLGLAGGLFGCLLVLPLNGMQTGTMNAKTFSESVFAFQMTPTVLIAAVGFALVLGFVGGAIPALKAARMSPTVALRRR